VGLNTQVAGFFCWLLMAASCDLKLAALDAAVQCRCCGAVQMGIKSTRIEEDICQSQTMPSCRQRNVLQHFNVSATFYENPVCRWTGGVRGGGGRRVSRGGDVPVYVFISQIQIQVARPSVHPSATLLASG